MIHHYPLLNAISTREGLGELYDVLGVCSFRMVGKPIPIIHKKCWSGQQNELHLFQRCECDISLPDIYTYNYNIWPLFPPVIFSLFFLTPFFPGVPVFPYQPPKRGLAQTPSYGAKSCSTWRGSREAKSLVGRFLQRGPVFFKTNQVGTGACHLTWKNDVGKMRSENPSQDAFLALGSQSAWEL